MATLTENEIIDIIYALYETDDEGWDTTSSEYVSARAFCNAAIREWERYNNTTWRELFTALQDSTQSSPTLAKTTTAGTYTYTCPTNFLRMSSWVRTQDGTEGTPIYWEVVSPEKISRYHESDQNFCWVTGSLKDGFTLHFNPEKTLTTGHTIHYEYYKQATLFTATTSTTEVSDPYFIVYYSLARILKNDGEDYSDERDTWKNLLENMRTTNLTGYFDINDPFSDSIVNDVGFGG